MTSSPLRIGNRRDQHRHQSRPVASRRLLVETFTQPTDSNIPLDLPSHAILISTILTATDRKLAVQARCGERTMQVPVVR
jgi:hypothetical protein